MARATYTAALVFKIENHKWLGNDADACTGILAHAQKPIPILMTFEPFLKGHFQHECL